MVRYHYALVDDLISREEFDRRIEAKIEACGNLTDDVTAALMVVRDLDRSHVPIKGLRGRSSLFCFYAKVLACSEVKEFDRPDGNKGLVARLTVADETGQTDLVFWDEQAAAIRESFEIGEVLEVIGRHGKSLKEILPLNLRKTHVEINCGMTPKEHKQPERKDFDLLIISLQPAKSFTRRDGTSGEMISGIVGDTAGTARLLCWDAAMLTGCTPGTAVTAAGALEKEGDFGGREIVIDENTVLTPAEQRPDIPHILLGEVKPDQTVTVSGNLVQVQPPRPFTRRDGTPSWVRNVRISDGTATLPLVIWDDEASRPLLPGEKVIIYHVPARVGRTGETELSLGRGSCLLIVPDGPGEPVTIDGTIIDTPEGKVIDDGVQSFLVEGPYPHGAEIILQGVVSKKRLFVTGNRQSELSVETLRANLNELLQNLG
ncbi:MAG: OB-fold nucleic acid binding domain-containing protein [Methanospirillum sp.]|uniref:OB-fold nucleic acid binding domain-containing protein n=1 Tax=Methanospirillum sp. TaxID=45200 RepID=UPI002369F70F|nr:OB-fold nucleic acid binding domain-containing protein [Methanospirillum sp.]MDD1728788.1 OB-fold nucleic acid binding domain-containing protein [Methanospirillum sp.]